MSGETKKQGVVGRSSQPHPPASSVSSSSITKRPTSTGGTLGGRTETGNNNNNGGVSYSSNFRLGGFTRSLMARASCSISGPIPTPSNTTAATSPPKTSGPPHLPPLPSTTTPQEENEEKENLELDVIEELSTIQIQEKDEVRNPVGRTHPLRHTHQKPAVPPPTNNHNHYQETKNKGTAAAAQGQGQGQQQQRTAELGKVVAIIHSATPTPAPTPRSQNKMANKKQGEHPLHRKPQKPSPSSSSTTTPPSAPKWRFSTEKVQGDEFLVEHSLGKGGAGEVFLVKSAPTQPTAPTSRLRPSSFYALKKVNLSGLQEADVLECLNEVERLVELRDSDLVAHVYAWEYDRSTRTIKILMEYGECDLQHTLLHDWPHGLPPERVIFIWRRLLTILHLVHSRKIIHSDLKPANFIWCKANLKIIDFGISTRIQQGQTSIAALNPRGTLNFVSPEMVNSGGSARLSTKSDVWALGCILFCLLVGRGPFDHISHTGLKLVAIGEGRVEYPDPDGVPEGLRSLYLEMRRAVLPRCFEVDYKRRADVGELLRLVPKFSVR